MKKIDFNKHVWEGWTVGSFIDELEWQVDMIMRGEAITKPFKTKTELAEWCMDNQPYHKKKIVGVNDYFAQKYNLK